MPTVLEIMSGYAHDLSTVDDWESVLGTFAQNRIR